MPYANPPIEFSFAEAEVGRKGFPVCSIPFHLTLYMINDAYNEAMPNHLYIISSKSIGTYAQIAKRTCCKFIIHFIFSATVVKETSQCWQWVRSPVITFDSNCGLSIARVTTPHTTTTNSRVDQTTNTDDTKTKVTITERNPQDSTITDSMGNITSNSSHGNMTDNTNNGNHSNQGTKCSWSKLMFVFMVIVDLMKY